MYIYIYIEREREIHVHIYIYIYMHIPQYIHTIHSPLRQLAGFAGGILTIIIIMIIVGIVIVIVIEIVIVVIIMIIAILYYCSRFVVTSKPLLTNNYKSCNHAINTACLSQVVRQVFIKLPR